MDNTALLAENTKLKKLLQKVLNTYGRRFEPVDKQGENSIGHLLYKEIKATLDPESIPETLD